MALRTSFRLLSAFLTRRPRCCTCRKSAGIRRCEVGRLAWRLARDLCGDDGRFRRAGHLFGATLRTPRHGYAEPSCGTPWPATAGGFSGPLILQSTPDGRRLYRSMGFRRTNRLPCTPCSAASRRQPAGLCERLVGCARRTTAVNASRQCSRRTPVFNGRSDSSACVAHIHSIARRGADGPWTAAASAPRSCPC